MLCKSGLIESDLLIKIAYADKSDRLSYFGELKDAIERNEFLNYVKSILNV